LIEEVEYSASDSSGGLGYAAFPIADGYGVNSKLFCNVRLEEMQFQAPPPKVTAD
jgi:hypothetical protein